jgi:hypothetical protein
MPSPFKSNADPPLIDARPAAVCSAERARFPSHRCQANQRWVPVAPKVSVARRSQMADPRHRGSAGGGGASCVGRLQRTQG